MSPACTCGHPRDLHIGLAGCRHDCDCTTFSLDTLDVMAEVIA